MRVCLFGRADYRQFVDRARYMADAGLNVHVFSIQQPLDELTQYSPGESGGSLQFYPVGRWLRRLGPLARLGFRGFAYLTLRWSTRRTIRSIEPDIIDLHGISSYGGYVITRGKSRRLNLDDETPVYAFSYGSDVTSHAAHSGVGRLIARRCIRHADHLYSSTPVVLDEIRRVLEMEPPDTFSIRPWGIKTDEIFSLGSQDRIDERARRGIDPDAVVVIHNRLFHPFWRIDQMVDVAQQFCDQRSNSSTTPHHFIFACPPGNETADQLAADARHQVEASGLGNRIHFLHGVDHESMIRLLAAADIFTCFGDADLLATSVLEAMAAGLVPVLRDLPAYREVIRDGDNGFLQPELIQADLLACLRQLAGDPKLRERIAQRNRAFMSQRGDARAATTEVIQMFQQLTRKTARPAVSSKLVD